MARDRQRAKRRQAERREARLRERGQAPRGERPTDTDGAAGTRAAGRAEAEAAPPSPRRRLRQREAAPGGDGAPGGAEAGTPGLDPATEARLRAAAPPEDVGRSDTVAESPPPAGPAVDEEVRGRSPSAEPRERERGRVAAFLAAVWAELQRVQWPDRRTLTTLTAVVLGFVVVMGAYLGGLDAVFSWLLQRIL
jgi:preprotein translocase subunit SecE